MNFFRFYSVITYFLLLLFFFTSSVFAQSLVADAGPDITVCSGEEIILGGETAAFGGTEPYSYSWTPANKLINASSSNPQTYAMNTSLMFYLTVTDAAANSSFDSVRVYVDPEPSCFGLVFYNTFTPNEDEINDTWTIVNAEKYPENKLEVFNRYGKQVYKAAPYQNNWNGKGLSDDLPVATYYYVFDPGNGGEPKKGSVTIIR